jgi:hypothetical protein
MKEKGIMARKKHSGIPIGKWIVEGMERVPDPPRPNEIPQKKYDVKLTREELYLLDGKCDEKVQTKINELKIEEGFGFELPLINEILAESLKNGSFKYTSKSLDYCPICKKSAHYPKYKSGSNKDKPNLNKPKILFPGYAFNEGFVTWVGQGHCCKECNDQFQILNQIIGYILDHDLCIEIEYGQTKYIKDNQWECFKCGKIMNESEMGYSNALFGESIYPSKCPYCGAESNTFGNTHKPLKTFQMLLVSDLQQSLIGLNKTYHDTIHFSERSNINNQMSVLAHLLHIRTSIQTYIDHIKGNENIESA